MIDGSTGDGSGDSSRWCMLYLAEKVEEKEGESSAPSEGGARRMVVIVEGSRRSERRSASRFLTLRNPSAPFLRCTQSGVF